MIVVFDEVDSTNLQALALLKAGAPAGTTVIARRQTQGRGQRGHTWLSSEGGIYLSQIIRPDVPTDQLLQITLWSAWGVCFALRRRGVPVSLKWPNDLVVGGRKLGGLLTETQVQGDRLLGCVVGVGVNGANQVPDTGIRLADLGGFDWDREVARVRMGLAVGYGLWQRRGFAQIQAYYRRWWVNRGQQLVQGTVTDIDAWGRVKVGESYYYPGQIQLGYGGPDKKG